MNVTTVTRWLTLFAVIGGMAYTIARMEAAIQDGQDALLLSETKSASAIEVLRVQTEAAIAAATRRTETSERALTTEVVHIRETVEAMSVELRQLRAELRRAERGSTQSRPHRGSAPASNYDER